MRRAYIGIGSNYEPQRHVAEGLALLRECFGAVECSSAWLSADVSSPGASDYLNLAAAFATTLESDQLKTAMKDIEARCGRQRGAASGGRVSLDLDLLVVVDGENHTSCISCAELLDAPHVLAPLAELLPAWRPSDASDSLHDLWVQRAKTPHGLLPTVLQTPAAASSAACDLITP